MITAPLVMPDVITGLSLLLLFVALAHAIGWPADRGMLTIWLAHVTFCTAYVAVVISSRLRELDRSIEEQRWSRCDAVESVFRHYATDDHARDHFWLVTGFYFVA